MVGRDELTAMELPGRSEIWYQTWRCKGLNWSAWIKQQAAKLAKPYLLARS